MRAPYQREAERAIAHLASVGQSRLAIMQVDDRFGADSAAGGLVELLGEHARGVIVSQVFPSGRSLAAPLIKEANDLARAKACRA